MISGATLSGCGRYRLRLWRNELQGEADPCSEGVVFIMLNPSTADAKKDDPTIRRCINFAKAWGLTRIDVVNLFAFRATKPDSLLQAHQEGVDVIGPENDFHMTAACHGAKVVIAGWGKRPPARKWDFVRERAEKVRRALEGRQIELSYLEMTADGTPRRPLFLKGDLCPQRWETA